MRVLVADDEPTMLTSIASFLDMERISHALAPDGLRAKAYLSEESFDAAVIDIRMPGLDGLSLLRWIMDGGPAIPVIMMSAHGDLRDAVEAMRLGAWDYLVKPFDPDELAIKLRKAVRERRLSADREASRRPRREEAVAMVGDSPGLREAQALLDKAAPTPVTVLVSGESGTGKEVAARYLHDKSGRLGAFVAVNLGAIPETLMESELFGYEKGAFTGAAERKRGLFELADGGTIFLDEIGEMPLLMQVKILRVLQERKVTRLGGVAGLPVDARVVAATNRDLEAMVREGTFREDLYYRVNVMRVHLPPLRDRPGDIRVLAAHLTERLSRDMGKRGVRLGEEAAAMLEGYAFPGNVRELMNALERAIILADGDELAPGDFRLGANGLFPAPRPDAADPGRSEPVMTLREIEKRAILGALERNGGRREQSARELGITRRTLLNKLNEYGINPSGRGS